MIEAMLNPQIISAAAMLPILGAVYQIYLKKPIVVSTKDQVLVAMKKIRSSPVVEIGVGSHDITPQGAIMNYTLQVTNEGSVNDTVGQMQISNSEQEPIRRIYFDGIHKTTTDSMVPSGGIEILDYGKSLAIAEATSANGDVKIFGMIFCKKKGEKIFTE